MTTQSNASALRQENADLRQAIIYLEHQLYQIEADGWDTPYNLVPTPHKTGCAYCQAERDRDDGRE
jgi:hypothetical protein